MSAEARGYDADNKVVGRKRLIAVDTDGRLLMVHLTPADIADSAGAAIILYALRKRWPWVKHLFTDGAYDRLRLMDKADIRVLRHETGQGRSDHQASRDMGHVQTK